jgi:MFS transporter, DHA1 family, inner membrane transport protein
MTKKQYLLLLLLALVQFTNIVDFMIIMPLGPKLKELWNIDSTQFSKIVSVFSIGCFISALSFIAFIDRFDRKKVLMLVYAGFTIGTFLCGLANTYNQLLVARLLTGLFGGVGGSIILSMVGDSVAPENRGQAMGMLMIGFSLASVLGVPGGLWLAAHFSWNTPFISLGLLCLLVFLGIVFFVPNFNNHLAGLGPLQNPITVIKGVVKDSNKRWALLLGSMMMLAHFMIIPFLTDYITFNLKFDFKTTVPYIYITGGLLSAFTSPFIGKLSDKLGRYKVLLILSILSIIPSIGITHLSSSNFIVVMLICATLFIFSGSRMIVTSAQVTSAADPQSRGSFLIVNSALGQLATGLAAFIGGSIISNNAAKEVLNYPYLGYIGLTFSVIVLLVFNKVKKVA